MFILIEKNNFITAIQTVSRFSPKGSATLPVLSCILLVAGDEGIKFRATNLEMGIDLPVAGSVKESGVLAIPAHILQQITASLTGEGSITFEQSGETALVSFDNTQNIIKTIPYEDFPTLPLPTTPKKQKISGEKLKLAIESVSFCASPSVVRQDLASIFLSLEGGELTAVATDSFRLAEKRIPLSEKGINFSLLLPAKNITTLLQTLPDDEIDFTFDENQAAFMWKGSTLITRLTNASYPDYRQIIPKNTEAEAILLKKDLELALRHTTIFSDSFQKVKINFDQKNKKLIISSQNTTTGSSKETIPAQIKHSSLEQSFNYRYLQTPLSIIKTESISLSASGVGQPLIIRGVGDNSFLYLVMPMNQ